MNSNELRTYFITSNPKCLRAVGPLLVVTLFATVSSSIILHQSFYILHQSIFFINHSTSINLLHQSNQPSTLLVSPMTSIRMWKSVYDNSDDFFNSHPAFQKASSSSTTSSSTSTIKSTLKAENRWNTIDVSQSMIEEPTADIRNEFDRHVLKSMGQRSNMHDAMSQPSRSPLPLDSFRRPRSTGHYLVSPSPRTKRLHKKREMIDSNSRASSVLSSNSSGSSSSSGTGSRTSLASSRNSNNISFSPSFPNKDKLYESGPASAVDSSNWGILDHQVQNRLQRMKADLQRIPEKVILEVQKKEVPLHQKKTNVLMNQLKKLKSKRVALENEIPMIINTVRAQKEPNDAYTRCWDPKTGVKMKVKDIENMLENLENDIVTVQNKNFYPIKMKKIYSNMCTRYSKDISSLAAKVKNIKHRIKTMKSKKMLQITTLTDIKHMNVTIEKVSVIYCGVAPLTSIPPIYFHQLFFSDNVLTPP